MHQKLNYRSHGVRARGRNFNYPKIPDPATFKNSEKENQQKGP